MFLSWNELPTKMKTKQVKVYYDGLRNKKVQLLLKRAFDITMSIILIALLFWLIVIIAILIKIDSQGPVLFRQTRITYGNKEFKIYKFRTMVENADKIGTLVTSENDVRITRIGNKIRKYRLDEIPQLFNVLFGDMSFVGTRPEVKKYVDEYTPLMMSTLLMPAGITSETSILFKDEDALIKAYVNDGMSVDDAYIKKILPQKMIYNLKYIEEFSFFNDIKILFKTLIAVVS